MINSISPFGNLKSINYGGFKAANIPVNNSAINPYNNFGTDGFSASRELQSSGLLNGMPPVSNNTNFLSGIPTPNNNTMPQPASPWAAMGASVVGNLLNNLINRIFGGGNNGGNNDGGGQVDDGGDENQPVDDFNNDQNNDPQINDTDETPTE